MNGQNLIESFRKGDPDAFEIIYSEYSGVIYLFISNMCGDAEEAKDICTESFMKLWNLRNNFHSLDQVKGFLLTTSRNCCVDHLRRLRLKNSKQSFLLRNLKDVEYPGEEDTNMELTFVKALAEIERLPKKSRIILKLYFLEGLKVKEIARHMGTTVRTVTNQKTRAVKKIRIIFLNIHPQKRRKHI